MHMKLKNFYLIIGLIVISSSLSACGGKRAKSEEPVAEVRGDDITRPPTVVKEVVEQEVERDAGDTISYEEWLRKREASSLPNISTDE